MRYEDALDRALSLIHEPELLEAFLRTVPQWRREVERALAVSVPVAGELRGIAPHAAAQLRAQQKLMSVVEELALASNPSLVTRLRRSFASYRFAIAGLSAVVLIALVFTAALPSFSGGGPQTAEAVIEGNVAEIGTGAVTISTNDSSQQVTLSSDTVLTDSFGNMVAPSKLAAGQDVVLRGSKKGDEFVASEVELRDRLFGIVTALTGEGFQLNSSKGDFFILVTPETEFESLVQVGSFVEIKLVRLSDGTLRALEVEVEDEDEDEDKQEDGEGRDDNSGPGSQDSSAPSSSGSSSVGEESESENSGDGASQDDSHDGAEGEEGEQDNDDD